jgi:hypothetical protein
MTVAEFIETLRKPAPPPAASIPLQSLWWDKQGDWQKAHSLVDDLETRDGMAVHAYLHRKEGEQWNADYWYKRAGNQHRRADLTEEWQALVQALLCEQP